MIANIENINQNLHTKSNKNIFSRCFSKLGELIAFVLGIAFLLLTLAMHLIVLTVCFTFNLVLSLFGFILSLFSVSVTVVVNSKENETTEK